MNTRFALLVVGCVGAAALAGCDDDDGSDDGAGGSGAVGPGGSGATGAGAAGAAGGASGGAPSTCETLCVELSDCGLAQSPSCSDECNEMFANDCEAEAQALIDCMLEDLQTTCDIENCQDESSASGYCTTGECSGGACTHAPDGGCSCWSPCGTEKEIELDCSAPDAQGMRSCDCYVDSQQVGSCDDEEMTACSLDGCCAAFF